MELERVGPLLLAALVALCYSNSLSCGFAYDDIAAIRDNRDLRPHTSLTNIFFNDFWGMPIKKEGSHKSYRPLTVLTFRANYAVHGLRPFGYHLVNVLLHTLVCLLFYSYSNQKIVLHSSLVHNNEQRQDLIEVVTNSVDIEVSSVMSSVHNA
ncbi:protein O-mannosyl-transferase Tmtc3 [Trichonephila inaurata madagascariensis]|uniref:Protein O-mannosyl-transferase Tmtc3 n=1 Tax=Trichonephila inaurata madagascariensis TaxID=2747483 RepID=A0A8X6X3W3_9ARAC|nr:protein O-mannosyl-transferase Tmtc3 [Trichonephila inaurata madagascariensis]